ncbi:MAG: neutral/alkaline non-lysosomal ceramidase N-terminal domain-containing protein [Maribacter sp.]|nr:neutral/alkaline non-lysosomal ceramidase N-terminal domain-containing protein [Maribacter sp.]
MKSTHRLFAVLAAFIMISFSGIMPSVASKPQKNSSLRAGVARINITPLSPIPMSGYGGRNDEFQKVRDSLYVTAIVFSDEINQAVIITADLIGFSDKFSSETIHKIMKETGLREENILLSATHNHGGPVNNTYGINTYPGVADYVVELQGKIIEVVLKAKKNMQEVQLGTAKGKCNMNINRRARLADGSIGLGRNPDGPCDHDVSVLRIDDMDKNPLALFVNWPCHGTVSGNKNYQITGDWPGATSRYVENAMGGQVVVPVTAGASADINPIYGPNNNFRDIDAIGMLVGEEVVRVAKSITTFPGGSVSALKKTIKAKGKKRFESRFPDQKLETADPVEIQLSVLKVGNIVFAGVSGELMTEIGLRIKAQSPFSNTIIITHCNGNSGYLCTNSTYQEGGYEAMASRTMPGTEFLISDNINEMIRSLP